MHHELRVRLDPDGRSVWVHDSVTLPPDFPAGEGGSRVRFVLHAGLAPDTPTKGATLRREGNPPAELTASVPLDGFEVVLPGGLRSFALDYGGPIDHPVAEGGREYARGFGVTPGLVSPDGAYLSGASFWYPGFGEELVTFSLDVRTPPPWGSVTQGERVSSSHDAEQGAQRWESPEPQREIHLAAGPWTEYHRRAGEVETFAFLRTPDAALAARYLEAAEGYLDLYSGLLGGYPYKKFALVENFWETGYGMPSFTLLGPKVLRFPFVITSSFPHEILHNWWGNGVFVDERGGNWSEGLTSYLADHLLAERRGEGVAYRRSTLQKYADYAARGRDFPLSEFGSRNSAATEAVGYGKGLFFFHMLSRRLGEEPFRQALRALSSQFRFRSASYADLRGVFERSTGVGLGTEFSQWVERAGAPALALGGAKVDRDGEGFVLTGVLEQTQPGEPYRLEVPVAVTLEGKNDAFVAGVTTTSKRSEFSLRLPAKPLRLDVDPAFDVFRLLAPEEVPPALSEILGAERVLVVVPAGAAPPLRAAYRALAEDWAAANPGRVQWREDEGLSALPADRAVWLLGWENRFLSAAVDVLSPLGAEVGERGVRFGGERFPRGGRGLAAVARRQGGQPLAWLASDGADGLPGLGRKLPHYHKWSYLVFEGGEPVNVAKGCWDAGSSPLSLVLEAGAVRAERGTKTRSDGSGEGF